MTLLGPISQERRAWTGQWALLKGLACSCQGSSPAQQGPFKRLQFGPADFTQAGTWLPSSHRASPPSLVGRHAQASWSRLELGCCLHSAGNQPWVLRPLANPANGSAAPSHSAPATQKGRQVLPQFLGKNPGLARLAAALTARGCTPRALGDPGGERSAREGTASRRCRVAAHTHVKPRQVACPGCQPELTLWRGPTPPPQAAATHNPAPTKLSPVLGLGGGAGG